MDRRLIFIGGSGRSGSTLLDLILNNHQQVQSVGEVSKIGRYARTNKEPCTCGHPVIDCPFWQQVERVVREQLDWPVERRPLLEADPMLNPEKATRLGNLLQKAALISPWPRLARGVTRICTPGHHLALQYSLHWYDAIRRVTDAPVIVDSTKDPRRLKMLYLAAPAQYRLLYMIRDGRAVTASAMRRKGQAMGAAARHWRHTHRRGLWAARHVADSRKMTVSYECLASEPEHTVHRVCEFLDLPFDPDMLRLRKTESHNIAGNPMRFRAEERTIELDERWRSELSHADLAEFDRIAGALNRRFGYD